MTLGGKGSNRRRISRRRVFLIGGVTLFLSPYPMTLPWYLIWPWGTGELLFLQVTGIILFFLGLNTD